jgi:hypothetical protein
MAVTVEEQLCSIINADLGQLCIPLPGGGEICFHGGVGNIPVPSDICNDMLPRIHAALAIMAPLMCLIDIALAIIECIKAIPDTIGPPPDPTALAKALSKLLEKIGCLLPLIPQLSICPLIKALLDVIINCLINIKEQLEHLVVLRAEVTAGNERSAALGGVALLDAYLNCAGENIDLLEAALSGSTETIQRLLDVTVNPLLQIAGLDPITFESMDFSAPGPVIDILNDTIAMLFAIRDALPC